MKKQAFFLILVLVFSSTAPADIMQFKDSAVIEINTEFGKVLVYPEFDGTNPGLDAQRTDSDATRSRDDQISKFYITPALDIRCGQYGIAWEVSEINGQKYLELNMDLFPDGYEDRVAIELAKRYQKTKHTIRRMPMKKIRISYDGPSELPPGVRLRNTLFESPGHHDVIRIGFEISSEYWNTDEDLSELKAFLSHQQLRVEPVYRAYSTTSNHINVRVASSAISDLKKVLDGIPKLNLSGQEVITRNAFNDFVLKAAKKIDVEEFIYDGERFDPVYISKIIELLNAENNEMLWSEFRKQIENSNFNAEDLRPDVLVNSYNEVDKSIDGKNQIENFIAAGASGKYGPFKASASGEKATSKFKSYAEKKGVKFEITGNFFDPKILMVTELTKAQLENISSFKLVRHDSVKSDFSTPTTIQFATFSSVNRKKLAPVSMVSLKSENEQLLTQLGEAKQHINSLIDLYKPQYQLKTINPKWINQTGIWPLVSYSDIHINTSKRPTWINCKTNITNDGLRILLNTSFGCGESGGDWTMYSGDHQHVIYEAPAGWQIVSIDVDKNMKIKKKIPKGDHRGMQPFDNALTTSTHWDYLQYCVESSQDKRDGEKVGDNLFVGLRGRLKPIGIKLAKITCPEEIPRLAPLRGRHRSRRASKRP